MAERNVITTAGEISRSAGAIEGSVGRYTADAASSLNFTSNWTQLDLNRLSGTYGEMTAQKMAVQLGETVIQSQYVRGAVQDAGIDFLSFTGRGKDARLFINSVKRWSGEVPAASFSEFGLGGGTPARQLANMKKAFKEAANAIQSAGFDSDTAATLVSQLRDYTARIRIIRGTNTTIAPEVLEDIGRRTGYIAGEGFVIP